MERLIIHGVKVRVTNLYGETQGNVEGDARLRTDVEAVETEADYFEVGVGGPEDEYGDGEEEESSDADDAAAPSAAEAGGNIER